MAMTAGDLMSSPVFTVTPDDLVGDVADTLHRRGVSGVPVVDAEGAVLGLVSEYDLLAKVGERARDVMTTTVITISEDTPIADVRHLLVERDIGRVPVVTKGRLVGVVSRGDVVALLATEWICAVCGEPVRGDHPPEHCPRCGSDTARFTLQEQPPGS